MQDTRVTARTPTGPGAAVAALGRVVGLRVDRQFRAGFDLVTSSAIGAVFGLLFWLVAARGFDEATVGVNAALISTMMLVAGVSGLGLPTSLVRFVPVLGARAPRFVVGSYVTAGVTTLVLAGAVGFVLGRTYDELGPLRSGSGLVGFAVACVAWQLFVLQDSVLVGVGRTRVVPVENTVFSVAKLGLLVLAISSFGIGSIFFAWVAPLGVIIVAVNLVIARRLRTVAADSSPGVADRSATPDGSHPPLGAGDLIRFSVGEHASALVWMGAIGVLPLIVLGRLGDEANAFYAMSWAVAYNLMLISANIGTAFIAEAANEPAELPAQRRAAMRQAGLLVVPGAAFLAVFAPQLLLVFGGSYAAEGSTVLRLLGLAAVAHVPVAVAMATLRAQRHVRDLFVLTAAEVGLVSVLTVVLIGRLGVTGVGLAWLLAETFLGVAILYRDPGGALATAAGRIVDLVVGRDRLRPQRLVWLGLLGVSVEAVALGLLGLSDIPADLLGDVGLVSVVGPLTVGATLVVIGTAILAIARPVFEERWAAAHTAAVVVLLAAAPSVAYESVRYPWAYKHIGIVDFIMRRGGVDRGIDVLDVYHNWPGFFAGYASLTELTALTTAIPFAKWAPATFDLLVLLALAFTLRQLTSSRRAVWLACLLFFVTNWIGQDYFAPQALALVLYLVIIGLTLRFYRHDRSVEPTFVVHTVLAVAALALVSSHQLTPFFLIAALVGLAVVGETTYRPAIVVGSALVGWIALGATPFVAENLAVYVGTIGLPSENAAQSFGLAAERSAGQVVVAYAGRVVLLIITAIGSIGAWRAFRRPRRDLAPFVLAAAPLPGLFLAFGGEILFRVVLFALPMVALFAAEALLSIRPARLRTAAMAGVAALALVPFSFAYYGKDGFYTFSADEVALVDELSRTAPDDSLLIEGTRNYPAQFVDYEKFLYVPIGHEPTETIQRIRADPADELYGWMSSEGFAAAYVLLTDGQQAEVEAVGSLPRSFLPDLERALRHDERFVVAMENDAGVVFTLKADW
ncbi:MAG: lipopolysaccharide biosynthesis protein [Acidimicrobiales bacterium]